MKYKLLKDLPGFSHKQDYILEVNRVDGCIDIDLGPLKTTIDPALYPEFFQLIDDQPERWQPRQNEPYYMIDGENVDRVERLVRRDGSVEMVYGLNTFRTEHQAEAAAEAIRAVLAYIQTPWGGYHGLAQAATPQWGSEPELAIIAARAAVQEGRE